MTSFNNKIQSQALNATVTNAIVQVKKENSETNRDMQLITEYFWSTDITLEDAMRASIARAAGEEYDSEAAWGWDDATVK